MLSIYTLKPRFQSMLRPLVTGLVKRGWTANQVTAATMLLCLIAGIAMTALHANQLILCIYPLVFMLRMMLNAIDGMMAREHDQKTPLGAMLNEIGDVLGDGFLYLPLAHFLGELPLLVVFVVMLGVLGEVAGLSAVLAGASRRYDGPFGKSDRALFFGILCLMVAFGIPGHAHLMTVLLELAVAASLLTMLNRIRAALAEIKAASIKADENA